jgi:opacity protein-like surface antigen
VIRGILALALLAAALPAAAQTRPDYELAIYAGYRFGGSLNDVASGETWEANEGGSFAAAFGIGIDPQSQYQYQVFFSHRSGALQPSGFVTPVSGIALGITYLHFGGTYYLDATGGGPYLSGGIGLTNFSPSDPGFGAETRFSMSVAAGYQLALSKRVALRVEGRAYGTLINSGSSFMCSGGCVVQIQGDTFAQGDLLFGVSTRF